MVLLFLLCFLLFHHKCLMVVMSYKRTCGQKAASTQSEGLITVMRIELFFSQDFLYLHSFKTVAQVRVCVQLNFMHIVFWQVGFSLETCQAEKPCCQTHVTALKKFDTCTNLILCRLHSTLPSRVSELESSSGFTGCKKHQPKYFPILFQCRQ